MVLRTMHAAVLSAIVGVASAAGARAGSADMLPVQVFESARALDAPVANSAFVPGEGALAAPAFSGVLKLRPARMLTLPVLQQPLIQGRDTRTFPGLQLEFFTVGDVLVPVQRGEMVRETGGGATASYWRVIPQFGRVWREKADGEWSRAAFPIMLVNDTENHAHQGLATFLYRPGQVSGLMVQFVQQTGPYLIKQYFVAWGFAAAELGQGDAQKLDARRAQAQAELADRFPAKPWSELIKTVPAGTLDGFGGPIYPKWQVAVALVRSGTLYYQDPATPHADKIRQIAANLRPYPWEPGTVMRYRDQDYYILGAAIDRFLKSVRGPQADLGEMVQTEIFTPSGIHQAPVVKTREAGGRDGLVWCNAGYYPTLDDLAKIAMLYEAYGAHGGVQLLNRELTAQLMAARDAIVKNADASVGPVSAPLTGSSEDGLYKMGFHFLRYVNAGGTAEYLPSMHGSGDNEVILYPNQMISIVMAKASAEVLGAEKTRSDEGPVTIRAVERLAPF